MQWSRGQTIVDIEQHEKGRKSGATDGQASSGPLVAPFMKKRWDRDIRNIYSWSSMTHDGEFCYFIHITTDSII